MGKEEGCFGGDLRSISQINYTLSIVDLPQLVSLSFIISRLEVSLNLMNLFILYDLIFIYKYTKKIYFEDYLNLLTLFKRLK